MLFIKNVYKYVIVYAVYRARGFAMPKWLEYGSVRNYIPYQKLYHIKKKIRIIYYSSIDNLRKYITEYKFI